MNTPDPDASPLNPIPMPVLLLALVMLGLELMFQIGERGLAGGPGAIGWRTVAIEDFGYFGAAQDWMIERGQWPFELVRRYVTYPFLHLSFTHAVFGVVILLAIGKWVAQAIGAIAALAIFFASSAVGAFGYGFFFDDRFPLAGANAGDYGLLGAYTYLLFITLEGVGENRWRAFTLIGFLAGLQLFFQLGFGGANDWIALLAATLAGFALAALLRPGGLAVIVARFRRR